MDPGGRDQRGDNEGGGKDEETQRGEKELYKTTS
jgi:hypothetical protein